MGIYPHPFAELASAHHDVAHARLPALRPESGRASSGECSAPQHQRVSSFSAASQADVRGWLSTLNSQLSTSDGGHRLSLQYLAERVGCGDFRHSSTSSGVGRVDRGTERPTERDVLHPDFAQLFLLDSEADRRPLPGGGDFVRVWPDVETDARDHADRFVAARLLAAREMGRSREPGAGSREYVIGFILLDRHVPIFINRLAPYLPLFHSPSLPLLLPAPRSLPRHPTQRPVVKEQ